MSDISKITVQNETYDIKDATARTDLTSLSGSLGGLAYKTTASGNVSIPSFSVSGEILTIGSTSSAVSVS